MVSIKKPGREQVLDAAEKVLAEGGAASITLKAVALSATATIEHVRTLFGNNDRLINALFARWERQDPSTFVSVDMPAYPRHAIHTASRTRTPSDRADVQASGTTKQLLGLCMEKKSVQRRVPEAADLRANTPRERRQRIATLAAEGVLRLRDDAGVHFSPALWSEIFDDLTLMLADED